MRLERRALGKLPANKPHEHPSHKPRESPADLEKEEILAGPDEAIERVPDGRGEDELDERCDWVGARHGDKVRGRTLKHGDVLGFRRESREKRDGCRSGADDDDLLSSHIVLGVPELRVDLLSLEAVDAGNVGLVRVVVVVVPRAAVKELGSDLRSLAIHVHLGCPAGRLAVPVRRHETRVEANVLPDVELLGCVADILVNLLASCDSVCALPGCKWESWGK
mgnify:CR=1 FL=1